MRLVQHASVLPLLALLASAASFAACAKEETPASGQAWSCGKEDVPGGESIRCVQSALVVGGPSDPSGGAGSGTADAGTGSTSYDCAPGSTNPDCPPSGPVGSQTGSSSTGGAGSGTSSGNPPVDSNGGSAESGGAGSGTSDGNPPGSSQTGSASNGGGGGSDECAYTEDLPYCNPSSSTADGGTSSSGSSGGSSDCTQPNCKVPPGQAKKGSSSGQSGENSSGGTSSDGTPGTKKPYHCTKDDKGNKSCLSEPTCAPGSHPAPCGACVTDDESSSDCVPPDAGGCWVTGGGFIEAASLVPLHRPTVTTTTAATPSR
ncbi:hypothetical protein [Labilithrix luteola]|nr:hypothetical protein [Labilithrix luteola]